jgi:hypothetical protein
VTDVWESQQGWKKGGLSQEIDVEDWREELGGGQTEPVRSQESSVGGRDTDFEGVCHWQGGFEQHYKIGKGRVESGEKENLDIWNFGPLAMVMAEIVKI